LFKPGKHSVKVNVGYYTSVIGLGKTPSDTSLSFTCGDHGGSALVNFWREVSNVATVGNTMWSVSQAAPLRRVMITGNLALFNGGYSSGGYLSDSIVTGAITSGSQQQWFTRNSKMSRWNGGVWNMFFVGAPGAPPTHCGNGGGGPYTTVAQAPVIAEKPYIYMTATGTFVLRVPKVEFGKVGPTTNYDNAVDYDFTQVYVATQSDSAQVINSKLSQGLHVILTGGNYQLETSINVTRDNTVILGIGFPTLTPTNGNPAIEVGDANGVRVGGILVEAGKQTSQTLIQWGATKNFGDPANPGFMYDIFARVGGTNNPAQYQVSANECLTINHKYAVLDNSWLWRADHSVAGGVKNCDNPSFNGFVVNGDFVIAYGLAVEHQLKDGVVWNGESGVVYFYQCELPYDVNQQQFGDPGYVGYRVSQNVRNHTAYGVGVYSFFRDYNVAAVSGFAAPASTKLIDPFTRYLSGNGQILHVVNTQGATVNQGNPLAYICP